MSRAEREDEADFEAARRRNTEPNHEPTTEEKKRAMLDRAADSKLLIIPSHEL